MPADSAGLNIGFGTPFQAQIEYLKNKLNLPSQAWDDIQGAVHDRALIVAGAAKADLLNDLHQALNRGASDGGGERTFTKDFRSIVAKNGWTGWTGEGTPAGEAWRARIIYQTNMSTSYWAGRYKQMTDPEVLKLHPYWRYIHADGIVHPRPQHLAWHGLTLLASDPFWTTHFAPNGWMCHCRITSVSQAEGERSAKAGLGEPPAGWDAIDPKTGEQIGIDKSFGYAPGANVKKPLQEFIDAKLINLDAPIGARMWEALKPVLLAEKEAIFTDWVDSVIAGGVSRNSSQIAGAMQAEEVDYLNQIGKAPLSSEISIEDKLLVGKKAQRHELAGDALTAEEWKSIPNSLANDTKVYFDTVKETLLYVMPSITGDASIKLAVSVNFVTSRPRKTLNLARSGFKINPQALEDRSRYVEIR
jgi:hypothetical protein